MALNVTRSRLGQLVSQAIKAPTAIASRNVQLSSIQNSAATPEKEKLRVTMIPGDGIGPELMHSVKSVFEAADCPIVFEEFWVSEVQSRCSPELISDLIASINRNKVALKGNIATPSWYDIGDLQSMNMNIRKNLDLFAGVVRVKSSPGIKTRHNNVDIVVIREQTEGEYSALEHESVPGVVESLKIITKVKSERIAKFAFDYATKHGRKKVTAVHKANIMKLADGMFLDSCKKVAKLYPRIEFESMIVDNTCMQMTSRPEQFDVMVMPNLYGNILDNLAAGLVGGAGVVPGESYSQDCIVFETGARHPFAQAVGKNIANPTAMLMCATNMLEHMNLTSNANNVRGAIEKVIKDGKVRTYDLGGYSTTTEFTNAVIANLSA